MPTQSHCSLSKAVTPLDGKPGFANSDGIKDFALDEKAARGEFVLSGNASLRKRPSAISTPRFAQRFGAPASGEAPILPLILKDKVAAFVYADGGTGAEWSLDAGAWDFLVLSTGAWLEVNSLRKQAQKEPAEITA